MKNINRIKTVKTSFSGGNLTNYSGIYPLFKFMKKMKLNHLFEQKISLTDKKAWRQEPLSFRLWFIQLAGKFTSSGRVRHLKMYSSYYYKSWWSEIDEKIDAITFA